MCLAVPGLIVSMSGSDMLRTGVVDFDGSRYDVSLAFVPEAKVGDYVMVHVGFALCIVDRSEAEHALQLAKDLEPVGVPS